MSIRSNLFKFLVVESVLSRIYVLDQSQRFEDSYAITQEFREWLLDPTFDLRSPDSWASPFCVLCCLLFDAIF